jgi:DNA-binding response OmpR family regulator
MNVPLFGATPMAGGASGSASRPMSDVHAAGQTSSAPTREGMRILLVEDDHRMARLVGEALGDSGLRVTLAHNGLDGLQLAENEEFDALVLDVMLPGIDGIEVCRRLRQKRRSTPILLLTARDAIADRVRGLDAGADDYLVKPFAVAELLARLRALDRRAGGYLEETTLTVGDLTLDLKRIEATRGGRQITLTAREFRLLECLMRHEGHVLSREQLCQRVWGYDADLMSNVVETYMHYLRDKVDRGFGRPLLRTVRGVGYTIKA